MNKSYRYPSLVPFVVVVVVVVVVERLAKLNYGMTLWAFY